MEYCVYESGDDYKARIVLDILEKNGISTYCINMSSDLCVSSVKICVKEEDIENATELINQLPFLKNNFETTEYNENERNSYIIQGSWISSFLSFFIVPFFFNLEYIIYLFKNNIKTKYILLIANVLSLLLSIVFCIGSFEFANFIWKWNSLVTLIFSVGKFIELHNKKSNTKYFMIIPIILLILSYVIAYQVFNIRLF
jgi:hypothetical protein